MTGSSRGIGAATAIKLAEQGCDIAINYLSNADQATFVVKKIKALGQSAVSIQADVSDFRQVESLIEQTVNRLGGLNILVNNAGYTSHGKLDVLEVAEWHKMIAVTLNAAFYCSKSALPHLKKSSWGRIVNVASLRAMTGSEHGAHYASAKAGLIGLTKSLALELAPKITVNAISPGYTATDMNKKSLIEKGDQIRAKIPLRHVAEAGEIADVIAFLCSERARYITGETINVNGGIYMR